MVLVFMVIGIRGSVDLWFFGCFRIFIGWMLVLLMLE